MYMKLKSLFDRFTNDDIVENIVKLYPDTDSENIKAYFSALKDIKKLKPTSSDVFISLQEVDDNGVKYMDVSGLKKGEHLSLLFLDWKKWLASKITSKTEDKFSPLDIVSYCLWEMTFFGYSNKEVQHEAKLLFKRAKDIDNCSTKK